MEYTSDVEVHIRTLRERAYYLRNRVKIKKEQGWEFEYDQRERDALLWALNELTQGDTT